MARIVRASEVRDRDTAALARWLLGKQLVAHVDGMRLARRIVETEAYHTAEDLACHASRGRTARSETLFAGGGVWYVYLIYGMHEMLNLVTGPRDFPAAVLIRGVEGFIGPGRLTRALRIDRRFNAQPALRATGLWMEDDGLAPREEEVLVTPRIGIDYAGPVWSAKPWRFVWQTRAGGPAPAFQSGREARVLKKRVRGNVEGAGVPPAVT
ncbi:MAG: DNA-3-methyladenine glycosylase [Opitutaceae bacterium]